MSTAEVLFGVENSMNPLLRLRPHLAGLANNCRNTLYWFHPPGRLPDCIIIGAQKAGTTSLHAALSQHPQVAPSRMKEVHFADRNWHRGPQWYARCFPVDAGFTFESTPDYLFHPRAAKRISTTIAPNCKFIALLRDPVKRAFSHHQYEATRGGETKSFLEAHELEKDRTDYAWNKAVNADGPWTFPLKRNSYMRRGLYGQHLQRWIDQVGHSRILVLEDRELYRNQGPTLAKILDFVGLDSDVGLTLENKNRGQYKEDSNVLSNSLYEYFRADSKLLTKQWGQKFSWFEHF